MLDTSSASEESKTDGEGDVARVAADVAGSGLRTTC